MLLDIKICGLTTTDDARWALEEGADYLGFVLYPESPRCVSILELNKIAEELPETAKLVGVFVNEAPILVKQIAEACRLSAVQLHGYEEPADFVNMPVPVWRAVRLQGKAWNPDPDLWNPDRFVMDADSPAFGGAGLKIDWEAAAGFTKGYRSMLAGGLTPETVGEAIKRVKPLGVDVSSGVEVSPGVKDHKKISAFIQAARQAEQECRNYQ